MGVPGSDSRVRNELSASAVGWDTLVSSAMERCPAEILAEIFTYSTFEDPASAPRNDNMDVTLPPWNLSYVCRQWRAVALSTPLLWSQVSIIFEDESHLNPLLGAATAISTAFTGLLSLQLDRSPNCRISMSIWKNQGTSYSFNAALQTILSSAPRWRVLYISAPPWVMHHLHAVRDNLDQLEELYFYPRYLMQAHDFPTFDAFERAPSLRILSTLDLSPIIKFPWRQLTSLTYKRAAPVYECIKTLRLCPELETYQCVVGKASLSLKLGDPIDEPIHLRHLHTLILLCDTPNSAAFATIFDSITLPSLKKLEVCISRDTDGKPILNSMASLITRSAARISGFSAPQGDWGSSIAITCLQSLLFVEILEIRIHRGFSLLKSIQEYCLLPNLHTLVIHDDCNINLSDVGILANFIRSRWREESTNVKQLQLVRLGEKYKRFVELELCLGLLKRQGLRLEDISDL